MIPLLSLLRPLFVVVLVESRLFAALRWIDSKSNIRDLFKLRHDIAALLPKMSCCILLTNHLVQGWIPARNMVISYIWIAAVVMRAFNSRTFIRLCRKSDFRVLRPSLPLGVSSYGRAPTAEQTVSIRADSNPDHVMTLFLTSKHVTRAGYHADDATLWPSLDNSTHTYSILYFLTNDVCVRIYIGCSKVQWVEIC